MTSLDPELAVKAVALPPADLLIALAEAVDPAAGFEALPVVSVRLSGGHVLGGRLLGVGADRRERVAVLVGAGAAQDSADQFTYIPLAHLITLTVHDPSAVRDVLSVGALAAAPDGWATSRLQLRRDFPATREFPLDINWDVIPDSPTTLTNLHRLLAALRSAVLAGRDVNIHRSCVG
jgi:hypothetical protein